MGLDPLLVAGQLFSFSTLMLLVGSLTCKTVSRMTYTVLVETLNPTHSLTAVVVVCACDLLSNWSSTRRACMYDDSVNVVNRSRHQNAALPAILYVRF